MEKNQYIMWGIENEHGIIFPFTLQFTKRIAIKKFISGSEMYWPEIKKKYNHRAVKVLVTIKEIEK